MNLLRLAGDGISATVKDSSSWVLFVGGAVAFILLSMLHDSMRRRKDSNLPPGPRNWPLIGAMLDMEPKVHEGFAKLAKLHGPIFYLRLGVQPMVVLSSAEVAEELLKQKDSQFRDKFVPISRCAAKYIGFDGSVFAYADNDAVMLRRKIAITEFFTPAKIKACTELRRQEMAIMVQKVFKILESTNPAQGTNKSDAVQSSSASAKSVVTVGMRDLVQDMVQNVLFALVIGQSFDSLSPTSHLRAFPEILDNFLRLAMTFNVMDLIPSLTRFDPQGLLKDFKSFERTQEEFYSKIVTDRRRLRKLIREGKAVTDSQVTERNLVDVLLDAQEDGSKISDSGISATLVSMLMAGIDSTGSQAEWVLLELARHPEIMERLQAEVDGVVGTGQPVAETDLQNMPFLNAVVMEALRLHPIAPLTFPHVNKETTTLGGYTIPAKTCVLLNIPCVNRDPKRWKDPLQFNPERFMGAEGEKIKANGTNFNLLSFAGGRRGCPGYTLAWVLLLRATATLVHAFDWVPPSGLSHTDLSGEERGTVILHPVQDLLLTPKPRVSSNIYQSKVVD